MDLDQTARQHLAARRFRKARDDFKVLCKKDRPKYLPLLIEANIGLAEEMLEKGQSSEAQQVIAYLKTIAPPSVISGIELRCTVKSGNLKQATDGALTLLATASESLSAADKIRWADHLVLSFSAIPASTPTETLIAAEIRSIHAALDAIAAGQLDHASDLLRPLPRQSFFSHWKIFIKAVAAFHAGHADKAARFFEELPDGSALSSAREPYLLALGRMEIGRHPWSEPAIEAFGQLHGLSNWGRILGQAQTFWLNEKFPEAYLELRNGIPEFPREGPVLLGCLSDFFFNAPLTMPEETGFPYLAFLEHLEHSASVKNPAELSRIRRLLCLRNDAADASLKNRWEGFLEEQARVHGKNPRLESLAYGWLGEKFGEQNPFLFFGSSNRELRNSREAIAAFEKSITLDPGNLDAHLKLCAVYKTLGMTSKRNRLLDLMSRRFPESKDVLILAGRGCLERKSHTKGIGYLTKVLQLDRIDPAIPELLISAFFSLAIQHYQNGASNEGRKTMERSQEFLQRQPENFLRNHWCHLARHGLLELQFGDGSRGTALLEQSRSESPAPVAFFWFSILMSSAIEAKETSQFQQELAAALKTKPCIIEGSLLVRIYDFWKTLPSSTAPETQKKWLISYLHAAIQKPWTQDEAVTLIETLLPHPELVKPGLILVDRLLKKDHNNPLFLCYQHLFQAKDPSSARSIWYKDEEYFEALLDEATRRGDRKAMDLARQILEAEKRERMNFGPPGEFFEDDEDDDFQNTEEPGSFDDLPPFPQPPPEMLERLAKMSDKEIEAFSKTLPVGIPKGFLEFLIDLVKGRKPSMPPFPLPEKAPEMAPPKQPQKAPRPQKAPNPNQMDLF